MNSTGTLFSIFGGDCWTMRVGGADMTTPVRLCTESGGGLTGRGGGRGAGCIGGGGVCVCVHSLCLGYRATCPVHVSMNWYCCAWASHWHCKPCGVFCSSKSCSFCLANVSFSSKYDSGRTPACQSVNRVAICVRCG